MTSLKQGGHSFFRNVSSLYIMGERTKKIRIAGEDDEYQ